MLFTLKVKSSTFRSITFRNPLEIQPLSHPLGPYITTHLCRSFNPFFPLSTFHMLIPPSPPDHAPLSQGCQPFQYQMGNGTLGG
ncbi:hypothetical protein CDAR_378771, partial [Caerostris darwini]